MTGNHHIGSLHWMVALLSISLLASTDLDAQDDHPGEPDEIKAVFRISKPFLDDATDEEIVAELPFCAKVIGFRCSTVIHGTGTATILLPNSPQTAVLTVDGRGTGQAFVRGVHGPIVALAPAWGSLKSHSRIQFDGREFTYLGTDVCVDLHARLQRITGPRDRRLGRLLGAGAKPLGKNLVPCAIDEATPIVQRSLENYIKVIADEIIAKLNERTPVEESVNRLFPETRDWIFRLSSNTSYIQAAYGPAGAEIPRLPDFPTEMPELRLEAWLRSTSQEAKFLANLSKNPLAEKLVQRYLESTLPELAAVAPQHSVDAVDQWVVIRVAAGPDQ